MIQNSSRFTSNPYKNKELFPGRRRKRNVEIHSNLNRYDRRILLEVSKMQERISKGTPSKEQSCGIDDVPFSKLSPCVREILSAHFKASKLEKWRKKKEMDVEKILRINKKWRAMKKRSSNGANKTENSKKKKERNPKTRERSMFKLRDGNTRKVKFVRRKKDGSKRKRDILRRSMSQNDILRLKAKDRVEYMKSRKKIKKLRRVKSTISIKKKHSNRSKSTIPFGGFKKENGRRFDSSYYFHFKNPVSQKKDDEKNKKKKKNARGVLERIHSENDLSCLRNIEPNVDVEAATKFPRISNIPTGF